jgi:general secretion pathway protein L
LSADEAVIARFKTQRGGLAFLGATRRTIDADSPLEAFIREFAPQAAPDNRTILAVAPSLLSFRELEIPIADRRKLREIIPLELKGETALPAEELLFDSVPLSDGTIMAVWCRRQAIADLIATCTSAGLEPRIVTSSPFCWQGLLPTGEHAEYTALADSSAVVLFRGKQPVFIRALDSRNPFADLRHTVAALSLAKNIRLDRIYLHGQLAVRVAAEEAGADGMNIPCVPLPVAPEHQNACGDEAAARDLAGPWGVAQSGLAGHPVDFRYGALAHRADDLRRNRLLRITALLAVLLAGALFGEVGLRYYLVSKDLKSLDGSTLAIYKEIFPTRKKPTDPVAEVRSEIRQLGGGAAAQDVLKTLRVIAESKGDEVTGLYEAELDSGQLTVKGDARSLQAVNDFRGRLAKSFATVEIGEQKSKPDGTVSFTIRGTLKENGK